MLFKLTKINNWRDYVNRIRAVTLKGNKELFSLIGRRKGKKYKLGPLIAKQEGVAEICNVNSVLCLFESLSGVDKKLNQAAWVLLYYALWHNWHVMGRRNGGSVFETLR